MKPCRVLFTIFACAAFSAAFQQAFAAKHEPRPEQFATTELLAGPPAFGSWRQKADLEAYAEGLALRETERGKQAAEDADLSPLEAFEARFSRVAGITISKDATPETDRLLSLAMSYVYPSVSSKKFYKRARPFVFNKADKTCRPDLLEKTKPMQSYPSGHTSMAWGLALTLAAVLPGDPTPVLRTGWEAGESRWICGAHWQSDVEAGRELSAAAFARALSNEDFREAMEKSREELKAAAGATTP